MVWTNDRALLANWLDASLAKELERLLVERTTVAFCCHYLREENSKMVLLNVIRLLFNFNQTLFFMID
jgi:hypothetical protein